MGTHNYEPSQATDIYIYHPDLEMRRKLAYNIGSLCYVAGVIINCMQELLEQGEINYHLRWDGSCNSDGVILQDQTFDDLPHFELRDVT